MRDFAFEALAEVTSTDWNEGRGELNAALRSIKEQEPDLALDSYLLSVEIHDRAKLYKATMGEEILLTPSALAKHWKRVKEQQPREPVPTYPSLGTDYTPFFCSTCEGDKMVLVSLRPSGNEHSPYEEYAPCPDCNAGAKTSFWFWDGEHRRQLDPTEVRARMMRR